MSVLRVATPPREVNLRPCACDAEVYSCSAAPIASSLQLHLGPAGAIEVIRPAGSVSLVSDPAGS